MYQILKTNYKFKVPQRVILLKHKRKSVNLSLSYTIEYNWPLYTSGSVPSRWLVRHGETRIKLQLFNPPLPLLPLYVLQNLPAGKFLCFDYRQDTILIMMIWYWERYWHYCSINHVIRSRIVIYSIYLSISCKFQI